ncbi:MAG: primosomal protein N' [Oscillospiraceae bacterium]|jgi:primosomal protein N' (replication factor Y)|nr:primosomal protein N' [Oscillospiraceae bacterium]
MKTACVAVEKTAYHFDKLFSYIVPAEMEETLYSGCRVLVPFGNGNRRRLGVVFSFDDSSELLKLKPISEQLDKEPPLGGEMLLLAKWIKETCYCTLFESAKLLLPTGINLRMVKSYSLVNPLTIEGVECEAGLSDTERFILRCIIKSEGTAEHERLMQISPAEDTEDAIEHLIRGGYISSSSEAVRKVGDATVKFVRLKMSEEQLGAVRLTEKQQDVVNLLLDVQSASLKELCYFSGVTQNVVGRLVKNGVAEYFENEVYRNPYGNIAASASPEKIELSESQQAVYKNLLEEYKSGKFETSLLFGVTGSGKTSVFMRLIDDVVAEGKSVIVMVPEIALTPQTLEKFHTRYGDIVAVFHSALSIGQRLDEWKRVKNGDAKIAIGTRSAVFAPFSDLGLIIIDEEQEYTYKSESSPRYHARDVARFRCGYHKALLVLCSATPSLESYYNAKVLGKYKFFELPDRYGSAILPQIDVVDISQRHSSDGIVSRELREALEYNLQNGYQSILLHNRRGYNTFASCRACKKVLMCENCSVSMTYHSDNNRLMCHYCGHSAPMTAVCPYCGEEQVRYAGLGTQRVMQELESLFPTASILRMDADSTMTKFAHEEKLGGFGNGDYDIMVGTQMVAKGLDFERVTLAGVLMADLELYQDDFRSFERAFSLLTQVVGRSGRGQHKGRAIIQTMTPENPVIAMSATQDYPKFFESEIQVRKAMLYPPFSSICLIGFVGESEEDVKRSAWSFFDNLKAHISFDYGDIPVRVLGPSMAAIGRVNRKYRYKLIVKCKNSKRFRQFMQLLMCEFGRDKRNAKVTAYIDINPENV